MKEYPKEEKNRAELIFQNVIQQNSLEITEDWIYTLNFQLGAYPSINETLKINFSGFLTKGPSSFKGNRSRLASDLLAAIFYQKTV